jgi:hypothetical protein
MGVLLWRSMACFAWAAIFSNVVLSQQHRSKPDGPSVDRNHASHHPRHAGGHHLKNSSELAHDVDGLKNEDVTVLVASTSSADFLYQFSRIIPSSRTWMRQFANVFVMLEDTAQVRYALRHCFVEEYRNFTTFGCKKEPTYVLTRKCTSQYYVAAGICCKMDELLNFATNQHIELFAHTKFVVQIDDDTFLRPDLLLTYLAGVAKSGINHLPIVSNMGNIFDKDYNAQQAVIMQKHLVNMEKLKAAKGGSREDFLKLHSKDRSGGVWSFTGCDEIILSGWYQPFILNKAALDLIRDNLDHMPIEAACSTWQLSQDVGLQVYFWQYGIDRITFPGMHYQKGMEKFPEEMLAVHAVKHNSNLGYRHGMEDECNPRLSWPKHFQYNQHEEIGCGSLKTPNPRHDPKIQMDQYDMWKYYQERPVTDQVIANQFKNWVPVHASMPESGNCDDAEVSWNDILDVYKVMPQVAELNGDYKTTLLKASDESNAVGAKVCPKRIPPILKNFGYESTQHSSVYNPRIKSINFTVFRPQDCMNPGVKMNKR